VQLGAVNKVSLNHARAHNALCTHTINTPWEGMHEHVHIGTLQCMAMSINLLYLLMNPYTT